MVRPHLLLPPPESVTDSAPDTQAFHRVLHREELHLDTFSSSSCEDPIFTRISTQEHLSELQEASGTQSKQCLHPSSHTALELLITLACYLSFTEPEIISLVYVHPFNVHLCCWTQCSMRENTGLFYSPLCPQ